MLPLQPTWLPSAAGLVHRLASGKPAPAARDAYTQAAAALLHHYPSAAAQQLFAPGPAAFLLVSLVLADVRASLPGLLARLNSPDYADASARLAAAYDVLSSFVAHLVSAPDTALAPDHLLKLRAAVADALSATVGHLRERFDASVAGAAGLHPDARSGGGDGAAPPAPLALAWDASSPAHAIGTDPLVLAALRALGLWLREDDAPALRAEAAGLMDVFLALYASGAPPFRDAVLVALEGVTAASADDEDDAPAPPADPDPDLDAGPDDAVDGAHVFLGHGGFAVLTADVLAILRAPGPGEAARGIEAVRVLLPIVEASAGAGEEEWLSFVRAVAGWGVPAADDGGESVTVVDDFRIAVLQLATAVLEGAPPGVRRRYARAVSAVVGIAEQLRRREPSAPEQTEELDDVLATLAELRMDA